MKVELNDEQIETLAESQPLDMPKSLRQLNIAGVLVLVAGIASYAAHYIPVGIGLVVVGYIPIVISAWKRRKFSQKSTLEIIDYIKKNGALPPNLKEIK